MSVTDLKMACRLFGFLRVQPVPEAPPQGFERPVDPELITRWREQLAAHRQELAAVIVEPVVQGAGDASLQSGLSDVVAIALR